MGKLAFGLLRAGHLKAGERAARQWYRALSEAAFEGDPLYRHRSFSAYLVGVIEAQLDRNEWAEHWLALGREEADFDGNGKLVLLAACKFEAIRAVSRDVGD